MIYMNLLFTILFSMMPTCATEDSTNCSWDGGENSFVAITDGGGTDLLIYRDGHMETYPTA